MNKFSLFFSIVMSFSAHSAVSVSARAICEEKEEVLLKEFIPTSFDRDRTTVGQDQVDPIATKIKSFMSSENDIKITKIEVQSLSARIPFYQQQGKKKVIDPQSDQKNSTLAAERASFAQTMLLGLKNTTPSLKETSLEIQSSLAGPEFSPLDLNDRFVTPMTQGYSDRVKRFFVSNQTLYEEVALKKTAEELLLEDQYQSLYQVKFKPFQGFRLQITGIKKCSGSKTPVSAPAIKR